MKWALARNTDTHTQLGWTFFSIFIKKILTLFGINFMKGQKIVLKLLQKSRKLLFYLYYLTLNVLAHQTSRSMRVGGPISYKNASCQKKSIKTTLSILRRLNKYVIGSIYCRRYRLMFLQKQGIKVTTKTKTLNLANTQMLDSI